MHLIRRLAAAGVVAALGLGAGAVSAAAAFDLSGGHYAAVNTGDHVISFGGYPIVCTSMSLAGDTETGVNPASSGLALAGAVCDFAGFPVDVTATGSWELEVAGAWASGPPKIYWVDLHLLSTATFTLEIPILGCEITVTTPQVVRHGVGVNSLMLADYGSSFQLDVNVGGMGYTTNGYCPMGAGDDMTYTGVFDVEGFAVDEV